MKRHLQVSTIVLTAILLLPAYATPTNATPNLTSFPDWKSELLGSASYAALFGEDSSSGDGADDNGDDNGARPPMVGPNVRVNAPQKIFPDGLLGRSETTIAVAGDGKLLVAGWNDADGFLRTPFFAFGACPSANPVCAPDPGLSGYGFSSDGGTTWTDGGAPFISGVSADLGCGGIVTRGDPSMDSSSQESKSATIYYANLAVNENPSAACQFGGNTRGISVHRGHFTGTSFTWTDVRLLEATAAAGGKAAGFPYDFYDKELLVTDKNRPHVFVTVTNFVGDETTGTIGCGFGQIELWRSLDGGNTWITPPVVVQEDQVASFPNGTLICDTGRLMQGSAPAVAPNGDVYVAWHSGPDFVGGATVFPADVKIHVARCRNFGAGPCTTVLSQPVNSVRFSAPQGYNRNRIQDFPRIEVNEDGRVFVVFAHGTNPVATSVFSNFDIRIMYSDTKGTSWKGPFNVNPPGDGRKDWWPDVTLDEEGNPVVLYYSSNEVNLTPSTIDIECIPGAKQAGGGISQDGRRSSLVDVFLAQSLDGGKTFETPVKVNDLTSNWCKTRSNIRPNFGDYIEAVGHENKIFVTWADGRCGAAQTTPCPPPGAGTADTLPPPAGPRDREVDVFFARVRVFSGDNG